MKKLFIQKEIKRKRKSLILLMSNKFSTNHCLLNPLHHKQDPNQDQSLTAI